MTSPESIARQFKRVRYSYHRDLFTLLGHPDIAAQFDKIWNLCEPHMETDPHEPLVGGQPPEYWLKEWIPYINNPTFYASLIEVLEAEATVDEQKGRTKLALMLRHVIRLIEPLCEERIYIETTHHVGCDVCGRVPEPPYLVIAKDEDTALSACMACVKRVLDERGNRIEGRRTLTQIATEVLACAKSWEAAVTIVGNVRADELAALAGYVLGHPFNQDHSVKGSNG